MLRKVCLNLAKFFIRIYCKYSKKHVVCVRFYTQEYKDQMEYENSLPSEEDIDDNPELWQDVDLGL